MLADKNGLTGKKKIFKILHYKQVISCTTEVSGSRRQPTVSMVILIYVVVDII